MKVLLTTISLDAERGGGTAQRTLHLAQHLKLLGADCHVVAMTGGNLVDELVAASIPVDVTGAIRIKFSIPLLKITALPRLVRDADVIHVLGYWNLLSAAVCYFASVYRKPYVLSAAGEFAALRSPRPVARAFHNLLGKRMIRGASSIVAVTSLERDQIIGDLGAEPDGVIVIPNGVDELKGDVGTGGHFPFERFILFLGRLALIKGTDLLLDAFAAITNEFSDARLVIAGPDFGLRKQLEQRTLQLGLGDRVSLVGFLDEQGRRDAFRSADFVVVPSRTEAMSLVALESGAAAKPVLLTDQCGFDEIEAFGGGRVVPASVEGLIYGLRTMLCDKEKLALMGKKLHAMVMERYAWPVVAGRLLDHLATIAGRERR